MKSDIQSTRIAGNYSSSNAVVSPPVRLRGIIIASDSGGVGQVVLNTFSKSGGTNLFTGDVPSGDVINLNFPEDRILFPKGIYVSSISNITAVTLLTDKYSGPGPQY